MARSREIYGPYEGYSGNPVLTNAKTTEYFQNVGHADLFKDANGNWWTSALAWRSGPQALVYPMGRETVLSPVTWNEGEWPVFSPVRGVYSGWSTPLSEDDISDGTSIYSPDIIDFEPGSNIPEHFGYWRWPVSESYVVSPPDHPNMLQLNPSSFSISAGAKNITLGYLAPNLNLSLIMRRQTDTLFQYNVDVSFRPELDGEEAGVTLYLNQVQNMALGIVMLPMSNTTNSTASTLAPYLRFIVSGLGGLETNIPPPLVTPVPASWLADPVRLYIRAENETYYTFSAASSSKPYETIYMGTAPATIVSGGTGDFTGSLVGAYATSNGGNGTTPAYISRWRYRGIAQRVV